MVHPKIASFTILLAGRQVSFFFVSRRLMKVSSVNNLAKPAEQLACR
jgi:hypothetical protein